MAQAAQIRAIAALEARPRMSALQRLLAPLPAGATEPDEATGFSPEPPCPEAAGAADLGEPAETDWPTAIRMIRDVAARVRQARAEADEAGRRAEALAERGARQAEEAEARLRAAEAETRAALLRAAEAEAAARAAEDRACRAEEAMREAQEDRREAQAWLKRLYACVLTEFEDLAETLGEDPAAQAA